MSRGRKVRLSPHQIAFNLKHGSIGLPVWILVQFHPRGTPRRPEIELRLYHGQPGAELNEKGMDTKPAALWPLDRVDWKDLLALLVTEVTV